MTSASMTAKAGAFPQREQVAMRRLWWVGLLAIVASSGANLLVYAIAVGLFAGPREFPMLSPGSVITSTAVYLTFAVIAYAVVGRFARRPIWLFRRIAVVALLLSFIMPISAGAGMIVDAQADVATVLTLIIMHIVAAGISVSLLTTLAREQ